MQGVNSLGDPLLFKTLTQETEVIFSNILVDKDKNPYWQEKDGDEPCEGLNFSGEWKQGKLDLQGKEIPSSHKNSRYTIALSSLENIDDQVDNPKGVLVKGIIYGGRDSDTWVPLCEAFSWQHGIITMAASLESETTQATLGREGVRNFNPMSNLDFLSISLGTYINNNLKFGEKLDPAPKIFAVNYFLKGDNGKYLNEIEDKHAWLKWMEKRVHGEIIALLTPLGYIPKYEDLKLIFKETLNKNYSELDYINQFTIRINENLAKIERIRAFYTLRLLL